MTYVKDLDTGGVINGTNNTTIVSTLNVSAAAGNTVVAIIGNNSTQTVTGVADSRGNTWSLGKSVTHGATSPSQSVAIWFTNQDVGTLVASDTVTATLSANNTGKAMFVQEYEGRLVLDQTVSNQANLATALTTGTSPSTTRPDEVVIAGFCIGTGQASWTSDAAYSLPTANLLQHAGNSRTLLSEYKVTTQTGTQVATGTIASATQSSVLATFYVLLPRYPAINHQNPGIL